MLPVPVAGVPVSLFDEIRAGSIADRSQLYRDLADEPFFGNNRPGASVAQGARDAFCRQGLQTGHRKAHECIAAFSAHGITDTHKEQLGADLLEFLNATSERAADESRHVHA